MHEGHTHMIHSKKPFWKSIFVSATHCGAGCEIGDFIGEWLVFLVLSGITIAGNSYKLAVQGEKDAGASTNVTAAS